MILNTITAALAKILGRKTDAAHSGASTGDETLTALIRQINDRVIFDDWGLSVKATVTGIVGSPTHFQSDEIVGFGDDFFAGNYEAYCVWDKGGSAAAPQGEHKTIISSTDAGDIEITAFTTPLAVGDIAMLRFKSGAGDATEAKEDAIIAEVEASPMKAGEGSIDDYATTGELVRHIADNPSGGGDATEAKEDAIMAEVEASSMKAGEGNIGDYATLGEIARYIADNATGGDATEAKEDTIITAVGAADDTATASDLSDITTTSLHAKLNNALPILVELVSAFLYTLGDFSSDHLISLVTKWGDSYRSLTSMLGTRYTGNGTTDTIGADIVTLQGNADAKTSEVHKQTAGTGDGASSIGKILFDANAVLPASTIAAKTDIPTMRGTDNAMLASSGGAMDDTATAANLSDITTTTLQAKVRRALLFLYAIPTTAMRGTDNAALATNITVPTADTTDNVVSRDVVGNKADVASTATGTTSSEMAYIKGLIASGLAYGVPVTTATDTTHFKATSLIGKGDAFYKNWLIWVLWDAGGAGAAPQGESTAVVAYTSSDGTIQHAEFTQQLALTDKVLLIHPVIATLINATYGLSAIETLVALIPTTAMRGTDGAALATYWTQALATALGNYTATRAGYLDNLSGGAVALASNADAKVSEVHKQAAATGDGAGTIGKRLFDLDTRVPAIVYSRQVVPIHMNTAKQTINATHADKDFIASNTTGAKGLINTTDANVAKVFLILRGRVENTYAGANYLDCSTATDNQWQVNLDGGGYTDLTNEDDGGQMLDGDWSIGAQNGIIGFEYWYECTAQITNIDGKIGIRLNNGKSKQASMNITMDVLMAVDYKNV